MIADMEVEDILGKKTITDHLPDDWWDVMRKSVGIVYVLQLEE